MRLTLLDALSAAADEITREPAPATLPSDADEGATARINLRLPEQLKAGVEQAAARERLSVNAWLIRAVASALGQGRPVPGGARLGQAYTGWVR